MNNPKPSPAQLDALYVRALTHPEMRPHFFTAALEAELYTLVPRGPGAKPPGTLVYPEPGKQLQFMRWGQDGLQYYHVYTSARLAREAMLGGHLPEPMLVMAHPGSKLLAKLQRPGVGVSFNAATQGGGLMCNDEVVKRLLDGSLLGGPGEEPRERYSGSATVLTPEDYPTMLVQPVFDHLKTRPEVLAAWILSPVDAVEKGERWYLFALLTTAEDTSVIQYEVETVLAMINMDDRKDVNFSVNFMDYGEPAHATVMRQCVPFYASPDYKAPPLVPDGN